MVIATPTKSHYPIAKIFYPTTSMYLLKTFNTFMRNFFGTH